ncbi:MAG: tRNA pseudouridine(13) synthase TruD [Thermoplasmatales archaeon]
MEFSTIGIAGFYHELNPSGGKLRASPEDFMVEEVFGAIEKKPEGKVLVLKVQVKNWEHNRLVRFLARIYHVSVNRVYFSGTKDKRSVKIQYFSIPGVRYKEIHLNDFTVLEHFYLDEPLTLGSHSSNKFAIVVRDCDKNILQNNCLEIKRSGLVPNFYGPQRFGPLRPVTHLVGREIVRRNYEEAVRLFVGFPGDDRFSSIRNDFYQTMDIERALSEFPSSLDLEIKLLKFLKENSGNYIGAIKQLPQNLVSMFIHGYQGYLFNKVASQRIKLTKGVEVGDVFRTEGELIKVNGINIGKFREAFNLGLGSPTGIVLGYNSEFSSGMMGEIETRILQEEGVTPVDFKLPFGLSSPGERRDIFLRVSDLECSDGRVTFSLPPGAYATSVMREIMRVDEMANY